MSTLEFLRSLPDVAPPAALWTRIERVHARRRFVRRVMPLAAVLLGGVLMSNWDRPLQPPGPEGRESLVALIEQSHRLERDLATAQPTGSAVQTALAAELARVDAELLRAYARGAAVDELRPIWRARVAALESLVATQRHPDAIRI